MTRVYAIGSAITGLRSRPEAPSPSRVGQDAVGAWHVLARLHPVPLTPTFGRSPAAWASARSRTLKAGDAFLAQPNKLCDRILVELDMV
jgi:hypothetical protein